MMDYAYILRRAWQVLWQHKALWLFGLLVSLSGQSWPQLRVEDLPGELQQRIVKFAGSPYFIPAVVAFILFVLLVGLGLAILSALGRGALVDQVNRIENGGLPTVRAGWEAGRRSVWRVFLIHLLVGLPAFLVVMAGVAPFLALVLALAVSPAGEEDVAGALAAGSALACLFPALCIGLLLAVPTYVLQRLAVRACVLEGRAIWESIVRGWDLIRRNPGAVALLWGILAIVTIGFMAVIGAPICLLAVGVFPPLFFLLGSAPLTRFLGLLGAVLFFWLLGAAVNGLKETFFSAAWTVAYRDLTGLGRTGEEDWPPTGEPET